MWLLWPWYIYTPFMTLRQITKSLKSYSQYKLHQLLQLWQATQDTKARQLVEYAGLKSGETNMGTSLLLAPCPWVSFLPPHWTPLSFSQHYNSQQLISGKKNSKEKTANLGLTTARCCTQSCRHALLFILFTLTPTNYFYSHRVLTGLNLHYTEHTGLPLPPYEQWQAARWGRACACAYLHVCVCKIELWDNGTKIQN